jgi:hypothetical protein
MYKCNYILCGSDGIQSIEDKVVKSYSFVADNIGTNFACLIEDNTYSELSAIQEAAVLLKDYYIQLFYDVRVQTFAYYREDAGFKVHDPYLLEFIIKNGVIDNSTEYLYIDHQLYLPSTFGVDYDKTIFSSIENKDIQHHIGKYVGNLLLVTQKLSLLYAYPQDYYYMEYFRTSKGFYLIDIFNDPEFGTKIKDNTKTGNILKDILIGYFNDEDITTEQLNELKHIDYMNNCELYYLMPIVIYIFDNYVQNALLKTSE